MDIFTKGNLNGVSSWNYDDTENPKNHWVFMIFQDLALFLWSSLGYFCRLIMSPWYHGYIMRSSRYLALLWQTPMSAWNISLCWMQHEIYFVNWNIEIKKKLFNDILIYSILPYINIYLLIEKNNNYIYIYFSDSIYCYCLSLCSCCTEMFSFLVQGTTIKNIYIL